MLICGFVYWVWLNLMPIAEFASVINVLIVILIGAIVLSSRCCINSGT
jgi:hypothetical protein